LSAGLGEVIFGRSLAQPRVAGAGATRMASTLRRLIEELAVVKPGRKASRPMSDAAKAALGLDVPITEVLDSTLGPAAQRAGPGPAEAVSR
jgi:hypothetical protein